MQRIMCTMSYDGTNFSGFQIQPKERTVHGEIERALQKVHKGKHVRIQTSGRTDAGVHAKGQAIHFDTDLNLQEDQWKKVLNTLLPADIHIQMVKFVDDDFHVRYHALEKEYRYFLVHGVEHDVFKRNYVYHYPYDLDIDRMKEACRYFEGEHDFTSFASAKSTVKGDKIRTLYEVSCTEEAGMIVFKLRGSGFLYTMARTIIGTIIDIGNGKAEPADIESLFAAKDRTKVGKSAPAEGLFLWEVKYENM